jgi:anhydro-N-acetylmuramic acid kinase
MGPQIFRTIGLMSGTSADGVDAAYVETDGENFVRAGAALTLPYPPEFRRELLAAMGDARHPALPALAARLTDFHAAAVAQLCAQMQIMPYALDLLGFHGQTILHKPDEKFTLQIGEPERLARASGIDVVADFRSADVAAGGQGAPLVPLYHAALAAEMEKPMAIVANITYLGPDGEIIAFDTGPGCALVDDAAAEFLGAPHDMSGAAAARGTVNEGVLENWLRHDYFAAPPPKSLDRKSFYADLDMAFAWGAAPDDILATLTAFTAASIAAAAYHLPLPPAAYYITGGGRHNAALMQMIAAHTGAAVADVAALGWDGDALEAQAFGYLAARSRLGLPLTLPTTTGVAAPMTGGNFYAAELIKSVSTA